MRWTSPRNAWATFATFAGFAVLSAGFLPGAWAETLEVRGRGAAPVRSGIQPATSADREKALVEAKRLATRDAFRQAIATYHDTSGIDKDEFTRILDDLATRDEPLVLDRAVDAEDIRDASAQADVTLRVDGRILRQVLADRYNLDLRDRARDLGLVRVLAYSVAETEHASGERLVAREETVEIDADVTRKAEHRSETSSTQKSKKSESERAAERRAKELYESGLSSTPVAVAASSEGSSRSHLETESSETSKEETVDRSRVRRRIIVYEDPADRGLKANEIRAKLEELLVRAGFRVSLSPINLMNRGFADEDELVSTVLQEVRAASGAAPDDLVVVALNKLTALAGEGHRFTSAITCRFVRARDGLQIMPPKLALGESGPESSDDKARVVAIETALRKVDAEFPAEIHGAVRILGDQAKREAASRPATYAIRVEDVAEPVAAAQLKASLKQSGFQFTASYRSADRVVVIDVDLGGKSPDRVIETLEMPLKGLRLVSYDSSGAVLKAQ